MAMIKRVLFGVLLSGVALTGCVSKNKYDTLEAQNVQLQQDLAAERGQVAAGQKQISRLTGAIKYTIESDLLFAPGSWEMSKEGKDTLGGFARKLAPTQQNKLLVIGYTDNTPIGSGLERKGVDSNQELSQRRAESVRQFLISEGADPSLIVAVGQGDEHPVASNGTAEGRAKNRRVELSLGG